MRAFGKPQASTCIKLYVIDQEREKRRRRKFDVAKARVRCCGRFRIRLRIFALCRRMFTLELFTTSHFHFTNFALSGIRTEDESLKMVHTIATNFYNINNCSNSFNLIVTIINELPNAFLFYFNLNKSRLFDDHN